MFLGFTVRMRNDVALRQCFWGGSIGFLTQISTHIIFDIPKVKCYILARGVFLKYTLFLGANVVQ